MPPTPPVLSIPCHLPRLHYLLWHHAAYHASIIHTITYLAAYTDSIIHATINPSISQTMVAYHLPCYQHYPHHNPPKYELPKPPAMLTSLLIITPAQCQTQPRSSQLSILLASSICPSSSRDHNFTNRIIIPLNCLIFSHAGSFVCKPFSSV